jgi:hypothetical protein
VRAHPRTHALEYLFRTGAHAGRAGGGVGITSACDTNPRSRWPGSLPGDPCTQLILLTPIAVPVQWCAVQSIFESILEYLSIYLSIYLLMYLSICSWSLPCQRCLCWSLPCVCVCVFITAVPMKKLFAWGDWCECVCLLIILHLF